MTRPRRRSPIDAVELVRLATRAQRMIADGSARAIRERAGLSRDELARHLRVRGATVWNWENGKTEPRDPLVLKRWLETLDELAAIVGDDQDQAGGGELAPTGTEGGGHAT